MFSRKGPSVHLLIKGRIGDGWLDVDRVLRLSPEATLSDLLDLAEKKGIPMRGAIEQSPHLAETLMWNGERCPVADNLGRVLEDGDQVYLLAPVAGG
jgi:molybdopterin converting factor small subunit